MKISALKIKKMARSVIRGEKHYGEHLMLSPRRDWYLGVAVFLSIGIIGGLWAATMFFQYQETDLYEISKPVEIEVYKSATMEAALKELDDRSVQYKIIEERLTTNAAIVSSAEEKDGIIINKTESVTESISTEEVIPESGGGAEPAL